MSRAHGTIVAVRDDISVGDAQWLDAYRRVVPRVDLNPIAPIESVVMDTMVASHATLADEPAGIEALASRGNDLPIEMAQAV